ncbi:short-chain dehydrogenase/reductase [Colletotrichum asianum]
MEKLFEKKTLAIITGRASGIGLALAQKCVKAGMFVFACDKDQHAVKYVMETYGQSIKAVHMDLSQSDDWVALKKIVDDEYSGRVALLVLNAGIKPESSFDSVACFHTTLNTNVFGVVCGIGALLPSVKASAEVGNRSAIVITGSKQGITNPPGYPAYNASKAAINSIAEQLSFDLRNTERVSVHLLVPGWTHTGMGGRTPQTSLSKPDGAWWPEQVVEYLEKKMQEDQFWMPQIVLSVRPKVSEWAVPRPRKLGFLTVPIDIRYQIYKLVLIDPVLLWDKRHKLNCRFKTFNPQKSEPPPFLMTQIDIDEDGVETIPDCDCGKREGTNLLLANRQIHEESAPIFWSRNTFCCLGGWDVVGATDYELRTATLTWIKHISIMNPEPQGASDHIRYFDASGWKVDREWSQSLFWPSVSKLSALSSLQVPPHLIFTNRELYEAAWLQNPELKIEMVGLIPFCRDPDVDFMGFGGVSRKNFHLHWEVLIKFYGLPSSKQTEARRVQEKTARDAEQRALNGLTVKQNKVHEASRDNKRYYYIENPWIGEGMWDSTGNPSPQPLPARIEAVEKKAREKAKRKSEKSNAEARKIERKRVRGKGC